MNLRIEENTIRFRLSRAEAAVLSQSGRLECAVAGMLFSPSRYGLILRKEIGQPGFVEGGDCLNLIVPDTDWHGLASKKPSKTGLAYSVCTKNGQIISVDLEIDIRKDSPRTATSS